MAAELFHRDYLLRLPLPLAQLYVRCHNAKDARGRHDNAFYLFEAMIKLSASVLVAGYRREIAISSQRDAAIDRLLMDLSLPSLGQWVGIGRELAKHFGARPDAASHPLGHLYTQLTASHRDRAGMIALYRRIKNGPDGAPAGDSTCSVQQLIEALVQYRNAVFGHGGARFESFYENQMGPLLFPAINELFDEGTLDILGPKGARLVYLSDLRHVADNQRELSLRELTGLSSERLAPIALGDSEAADLSPGVIAVIWPGQKRPLRLDPLLLYRESELAEEVLFLNRDRHGKQVEYLSYSTGRTDKDASMAGELAKLLKEVGGSSELPVASCQLPDSELPAVSTLGDYEILAELGRGGMGVVYLARQLSLNRIVALKMLPADLAGDSTALTRFNREIRALARCEHPNIVKVLTSGVMPDGQLYYAMEYVAGCDLEQVWRELSGSPSKGDVTSMGSTAFAKAVLSASVRKRDETLSRHSRTGREPSQATAPALPLPPLPPLPKLPPAADDPGGYVRRIVMLVRDAALGLAAVHEQHIVHRDIKPANMMLSADGSRIVLMDFGLAKGESVQLSASRQGGLLGTMRYAAPEQLAAASIKVGPQADVRGLGVTLWELLTRRRLFGDAEDEKQLAMSIFERDVPLLRSVDPSFDRDLEAIVARATDAG